MVRNGQQIAKTLLQHRRPAKINLDVACVACGVATDSLRHTYICICACVRVLVCVSVWQDMCVLAADVAPLPQGVYRLIDIDTVGSYVAGAVASAAAAATHIMPRPSLPTRTLPHIARHVVRLIACNYRNCLSPFTNLRRVKLV